MAKSIERPLWRPEQGTEYTCTMVFDTPLTGSKDGHDWIMYTLNVGGEGEVRWFAPDTAHENIQALGLERGHSFILVKTGRQGRDDIIHIYTPDTSPQARSAAPPAKKPAVASSSASASPPSSHMPLEDHLKGMDCIVGHLLSQWGNVLEKPQIQALACTLYIQACREGALNGCAQLFSQAKQAGFSEPPLPEAPPEADAADIEF